MTPSRIVGPFLTHHVRNTGIAFGLFSDSTTVVIALTAVAIAPCSSFSPVGRSPSAASRRGGPRARRERSNLADRLRLGYVTDFLDLDYWPAFNLADTFIVVGVGLLFLSVVAADRSSATVGTSPLRVPESDAGRRLDAVVAELPGVGPGRSPSAS